MPMLCILCDYYLPGSLLSIVYCLLSTVYFFLGRSTGLKPGVTKHADALHLVRLLSSRFLVVYCLLSTVDCLLLFGSIHRVKTRRYKTCRCSASYATTFFQVPCCLLSI